MFGKKNPGSQPAPAPVKPPAPVSQPPANIEAITSVPAPAPQPTPAAAKKMEDSPLAVYTDSKLETRDYKQARQRVLEEMLERVDFVALEQVSIEARRERIHSLADTFMRELNLPLNAAQNQLLKKHVADDVLGFGPIEVLMQDPDVNDIMINTHKRVYIEKKGKLYITDITFLSEKHLLNVIQKIVTMVGRRIDENSPMVDARMPDGSRFNAIIPPLALDGALVSIRKFKKNKIPLSAYVDYGSLSPQMAKFLEICSNIRLSIMVSGGTGSGKTTLLNALSGNIDPGERVITIEDAAELQLHQPHVLRLETRPPNTEGEGEITQRQLVKNALRMRPDRIILGEIRGDEVIDVLAAMNTGHDGSMATIHANSPRDCLSRLENLIGLAGIQMPVTAMRHQIASAIDMIVQIERMRDGSRKITQIEEIVGMEGDVISTQTLFQFKPGPMNDQGQLTGEFQSTKIRPRFLPQATYFNREKELLECITHGM